MSLRRGRRSAATGASTAARVVMACSWLVLLISAVFGLMTLMALTGSLGAGVDGEPSIRETNVTRPARVQAGESCSACC